MATRIALALLCGDRASRRRRRTEVKLRKTRGAGGDLVDPALPDSTWLAACGRTRGA